MADGQVTIKQLIEKVVAFEKERDWEKFHSPKNLAMGIAVETGELLEHFLWVSEDQSREVAGDSEQMAEIRAELADVLCYLLMLSHTLDVDLSDAFYQKMKRNAEKYPADKYRGKYKL